MKFKHDLNSTQGGAMQLLRSPPGNVNAEEDAHSLLNRVAKSAYYKRLWACFSVKSLTNIGSRGLRFFGLVSKV